MARIVCFKLSLLIIVLLGCKGNNQLSKDKNIQQPHEKNISNKEAKDTLNSVVYNFIDSIEPLELFVEEWILGDDTIIKKQNNDIQLYFLLHESNKETGALKVEIINNTEVPISYMSSIFQFNKNGNWIPLYHADGVFHEDIGLYIPPGEKGHFFFFFSDIEEYSKGKYRLYLIFSNTLQNYYYISKEFYI